MNFSGWCKYVCSFPAWFEYEWHFLSWWECPWHFLASYNCTCVLFFSLVWIWVIFSLLLVSDVFETDAVTTGVFFQALQYLNEITNDQVLTINPTFRLPDGTGLFAQIFVNGLHLNQDLIEKGYAMTKPVSFVYAVQCVHAIWVGLEPYSVFHVIFVLL